MALAAIDRQVEEIRESAKAKLNQIGRYIRAVDDNTALSAEGKKAEQDSLRASLKEQLSALRHSEEEVITTEIGRLERLLDAKTGNTATDIIAFRDAQDRAERLTDPDEASKMLDRAERTHDVTLSHAIFRRALDAGWGSVTTQFQRNHPDAAEIVSDLRALTTFRDDSMMRTMHYSTFGL